MTAWRKWWKSSDQSSNLFHTLVPYFENDTANILLVFCSLKVQVTYGNIARKWLKASGLPQLCLFKGFNIPSILIEYNNRKSSWKLTLLIVSKNYLPGIFCLLSIYSLRTVLFSCGGFVSSVTSRYVLLRLSKLRSGWARTNSRNHPFCRQFGYRKAVDQSS